MSLWQRRFACSPVLSVAVYSLGLWSLLGAVSCRDRRSGSSDGGRARSAGAQDGGARVVRARARSTGERAPLGVDPVAYSVAGRPSRPVLVLAAAQPRPRFLALDDKDDYLFFARGASPGEILRVLRKGGPVERLALASEPRGLALLGPHVYFVDEGYTDVPKGQHAERFYRLSRVMRTGGKPEVLARDFPLPGGLQADGDRLLWPVAQGRYYAAASATFLEHPGAILSLAPMDSEPALLSRGLVDPVGITADENHFYVSEPGAARSAYQRDLVALPRGGGERRVLASGEHNPFHLRSDGKTLYWTTWRRVGPTSRAPVKSTLRAVPLEGGEPVTLLDEKVDPWGLAMDGRFVYTTTPGGVVRVDKATRQSETLLDGLQQKVRADLTVDARRVYWVADDEVRAVELPPEAPPPP